MFTKEQINEIIEKVKLHGVKDTDIPVARLPLDKDEELVIILEFRNKRINVSDLIQYFGGINAIHSLLTIGVNGNWFINGTDTGVLAQGEPGIKGDKGENGKNGAPGIDGKDGKIGVDGLPGEKGEPGGPADIPWTELDATYTKLTDSTREWADAKATMVALQGAIDAIGDGTFTEAIKPITIQTMQLLVGDESLQFKFVESKLNSSTLKDAGFLYSHTDKKVISNTVTLKHMTLGIKGISNARTDADYKMWNMKAANIADLTDEKTYWLQARCPKTGGDGTFVVNEDVIKLDPDDGYYYFIVGILNEVSGDSRSFAPLYGFTEILPGKITTDLIASSDGKTVFDLANSEIRGNLKIKNSGTYYIGAIEGTDGLIIGISSIISALATQIKLQVSATNGDISAINLRMGEIELSVSGVLQGIEDGGFVGRGVISVQDQFFEHTSKTTAPTIKAAGWVNKLPAYNAAKFLWVRMKITYDTLAKDTEGIYGPVDALINYSYSEPSYRSDWEFITQAFVNANAALDASTATNTALEGLLTDFSSFKSDGLLDAIEKGKLQELITKLDTQYNLASKSYTSVLADLTSFIASLTPKGKVVDDVNGGFIQEGGIDKVFDNDHTVIVSGNAIKAEFTKVFVGNASYDGYQKRLNHFKGYINAAIADMSKWESLYEAQVNAEYQTFLTYFSTFAQTVDSIKHYISTGVFIAVKGYAESRIKILKDSINISSIRTKLDDYGRTLTDASALLKITPDKIGSYVTANDITSAIEQTPESIRSFANLISLTAADNLDLIVGKTQFDALGNIIAGHTASIALTDNKINILVESDGTPTGFKITQGAIDVIAEKITFNGLVKVKELSSRDSQDRITVNENNDNLMKFRHPNGVVAAEFGMVDGVAAMIWYDQLGNEVWRAGETGIQYVVLKPAYWVEKPMFRLTALNSYTTLSVVNNDLIKVEIEKINCKVISAMGVQLGINSGTIYYDYIAGTTGGVPNPSEVLKQGLYTVKNELGSPIPDGWYVRKGYVNTMETGDSNYSAIIYMNRYVNGKQTSSYSANLIFAEPSTQCSF